MAAFDRNDTCDDLGFQLESLRGVLKRLASSFEQVAKAEGAEAANVVSESVQELLLRATSMLDELAVKTVVARDATAKGRGHLEETIRKQPLLAVGIAAAVGLLVGSLRRR